MKTKTSQAVELFKKGHHREALKIAKTFRLGLTKEERESLIRAYECYTNPRFYEMIGKEPEKEIKKGIQIFEEKFVN